MKKKILKSNFTKKTALILLCFLVNIAIKAQKWTVYDGSVLPTAAKPAWIVGDSALGTPVAIYSIVDENGNKVLRDTTTAAGDKKSFKLKITQPTNATWIFRTKAGGNTASMEFEMNSKTSGGTAYRCYIRLVPAALGGVLKTNYLTTNVTYPGTTDSSLQVKNYHTYRITVQDGLNYNIYLDENTTPIATQTGSTGSTQSQFLRFGDVGSNFTAGYLDWMAYDTTAAYAPGTTLPSGVIVDGVAPNSPTALSATKITATSFSANWEASAGATGYKLDVATDKLFTSFVVQDVDVSDVTTDSIGGLTPLTDYYYRVRAYNTIGASLSSDTITATTIAAPSLPSVPVAISATNISESGFTANWKAAAQATGYKLDVAADKLFSSLLTNYNDKDVSNDTLYAVTGLSASTTYYYRVRAYSSYGTSESSDTITVTTSAAAQTAPPAPVATEASNVLPTSFSANWNAASTASSYKLDVATDDAFTNYVTNFHDTIILSLTNLSVTGLATNTSYYYRVRGVNSVGTGDYSNPIQVNTLHIAAPVANAATSIAYSSFKANWGTSATATGYQLDVATDTLFTNLIINNVDVSNVTSDSIGGLSALTKYFYRVRAYSATDLSDNSNIISLTTPQISKPAAPVAIAATSISQTGFSANWNASTLAAGYYLEVATDSLFTSYVESFPDTVSSSTLSVAITDLSDDTKYFYRVRAYNITGISDYSSVIKATTLRGAPDAPDATFATEISGTSFIANWSTVTYASGYLLDVSADSTFASFLTGFESKDESTATSDTIGGLTVKTTYYYRVRAYSNGGTSAYSDVVDLTTLYNTSVADLKNNLTISVQKGRVTIESNNEINSVQVVDILGRNRILKTCNSTSVSIGTEDWNSGVYIFKISSQNQTYTRKLSLLQ